MEYINRNCREHICISFSCSRSNVMAALLSQSLNCSKVGKGERCLIFFSPLHCRALQVAMLSFKSYVTLGRISFSLIKLLDLCSAPVALSSVQMRAPCREQLEASSAPWAGCRKLQPWAIIHVVE